VHPSGRSGPTPPAYGRAATLAAIAPLGGTRDTSPFAVIPQNSGIYCGPFLDRFGASGCARARVSGGQPSARAPERPCPGAVIVSWYASDGTLLGSRGVMELGLVRFEIVGEGIHRVDVDVTPQERAGAAVDNLDFG
jgi:hypothetical protein